LALFALCLKKIEGEAALVASAQAVDEVFAWFP
jgi:hypothetical protein